MAPATAEPSSVKADRTVVIVCDWPGNCEVVVLFGAFEKMLKMLPPKHPQDEQGRIALPNVFNDIDIEVRVTGRSDNFGLIWTAGILLRI
jgi:hypothetical protein